MSQLDPKRRVVVTGLGVVSSIGIGWQEFWKNLLAGKSGISRLENFDTSGHDCHFAGEVKDFDASQFIHNSKLNVLGRASQFAGIAAKLAVVDSKIFFDQKSLNKMVICVGTTNAENNILEQMGDSYYQKNTMSNYRRGSFALVSNLLSTSIAKEFHATGQNYVFGTACSSGNCAISMGFDLIKSRITNSAIVGGADGLSRITYTGFDRVYAIAAEKCQPFDLNRQGMIPGEGAGMLFLESLESAKKRNVPIYAEIIGCGMSCDAHHMTNPDPHSVASAIRKSLKSGGVKPEDIDYISAHGTGTIENDRAESVAYHEVFGHLKERIPMSSIKSMLGHTMGAAAALESIACCLAIKYGEIPPTINFENPDPLCDLDVVPNNSRRQEVNVVLNTSQAFGGNNVCLVVKKC